MKLRRFTALLMSIVLAAALMAGCGGNGGTNAPADNNGKSGSDTAAADDGKTDTQTPAADDGNADTTDTASSSDEGAATHNDASGAVAPVYNVTWDDTAEIHVVAMCSTSIPSGLQDVEDAINEITETEINTHVNLELIETGAYTQQINLMMSSGEPMDLFVTLPGGPVSFSAMAAQGQLMDISQLLKTYAPNVLEAQKNIIAATTIGDGIYGVPADKAFVTSVNIYMRTDVLEDLGMLEKAQNMTSFSEYEEILEALKNSDKWKNMAGVAANTDAGDIVTIASAFVTGDKFSEFSYFDNLGDNMGLVGVYKDDEKRQVFNYFETGEYKEMIAIAKRWYDKGYVYKDTGTSQEMAGSLIKSNAAFSFLSQSELGSELAVGVSCGWPMTTVHLVQLPITTASVTKFVWAVPSASKEPEAAITFHNMAFSDSRIANLLAWGIEGKDYEIMDNGNAGYIEGNENPSYHVGDTVFPSKLSTTPWGDDSPTLRQEQRAARNSAKSSEYLGFSCDTTAVSTEIGAVSNVIEEYRAQLNAGMAGGGVYEEFIKKLKDSGADKIIAEYQRQLDAWVGEQS